MFKLLSEIKKNHNGTNRLSEYEKVTNKILNIRDDERK